MWWLVPLALAGEELQLWSAVAVDAQVSDAVDVSVEQGFRGQPAPRDALETLFQSAVSVQLSKAFHVQGGYRFSAFTPSSPVQHRFALDLKGATRTGDVRWKFRQRYTVSLGPDGRHTLRPRVVAWMKFDSVRPFVGAEAFVRVGRSVKLHKFRFTAGTKLRFKPWTLVPYVHVETQLDGDRRYIAGLDLSMDVDLRRK